MIRSIRDLARGIARSPRASLLLAIGGLGLVTLADVLTPFEFGFSAFYVLPLLAATWAGGRRWGLAFALVSGGIWYGVDWTSGHRYSSEFFRAWNAANHLLAFLVVATVAGGLRRSLLEEQALREDLERTLGEVKELKGLLPVCAWCKKVRDDAGYWQEVEAYLGAHTRASFTHGICPDCSARLDSEVGGPPEG